MVSLATPGGGVGAHSDQFDVFLMQAQGHKRWRVCTHTSYDPLDDSAHVPVRASWLHGVMYPYILFLVLQCLFGMFLRACKVCAAKGCPPVASHAHLSSQRSLHQALVSHCCVRCAQGSKVRRLAEWHPDQEWVLQPGDVLYVPPRIGHEGTALDKGQTYSVGYLAPLHAELLTSYSVEAASWATQGKAGEKRYSDAATEVQRHPGEIMPSALADMRQIINQLPKDDRFLAHWLGRYLSTPRGGGPQPLQREDPVAIPALQRRMRVRRRTALSMHAHASSYVCHCIRR